ncbi:MAG: outer membrane beta-barrel protein [Ignavibacteriales bacterium]|nr:outer membrane beta-barrel protein [Ignavibacteriales bacterium]
MFTPPLSRALLALGFALALVGVAPAQAGYSPPGRESLWMGGFRAGAGISNFYVGYDDEGTEFGYDNRVVYHAGAFVKYDFGRTPFAAQVETSIKTAGSIGTYERVRFTYVEVPLLIQFRDDVTKYPGYFYAGGSINVRLTETITDANETETSLYPEFNRLDYQILVGAEYAVAERWAVDLRYSQSVTDIQKDYFRGDRYRNYSIRLGVLYSFTRYR